MSVTQYIGARYVPLFAEPIEWDNARAYEPLTIVVHQGNSYTSRQSVPIGIDILNEQYWALTGNYNAQVEAYRREVQTFDSRITENAQAISEHSEEIASNTQTISEHSEEIASNTQTISEHSEEIASNTSGIQANADAIGVLQNALTDESSARSTADNELRASIEHEAELREEAVNDINVDITELNKRVDDITPKSDVPRITYFIACNSGSDDNDGLTPETAFKTLDRAIKIRNYGIDDMYFQLIESGTYPCTDFRITNLSAHFYAEANNVMVEFIVPENYTQTFYNSYIHFEGRSGATGYKVYAKNGLHFDLSGMYANNVTFDMNGKSLDVAAGSYFGGTNCIFDRTQLLIRASTCELKNSTTFRNLITNSAVIHGQGSRMWLTGTFTNDQLATPSNYAFMRLQGSICMCSWTSIASGTSKFAQGLRGEDSYMSCPAGLINAFTDIATTATQLVRTLVMAKYAGEIIS